MIRFVLSIFAAVFSLATMGALFGALGIGAVLWFYARDLPSHESLAQYSPPTISRVYSIDGQIIDEFARERRLFTPIEDIPEIVKQAFIAAEDKNFYSHAGYDATGIAAAVVEAVRSRGQTMRGASTITQQVMKNFLLSGDRTGERKIKEIVLATRIERTLSKEQILELYLNEIFLGQNSYGVTAAAISYFNKPLGELTLEEVATLASMPTQPSNFHPVRNRDRLLQRRAYVLRRMLEDGHITQSRHDAAQAAPLNTVQGGEYASFREELPPRGYFTDEIRRQLSASFGEEEFFTGGLAIRATVDPGLQAVAAQALQEGLERIDRARGVWIGTGVALQKAALRTEAAWSAALTAATVPRDIDGWRAAVVLALTPEGGARIGIEGLGPTDASGGPHLIPASDVTWARKMSANGTLAPRARKVGDLVEVGEVVLVRWVDGTEQTAAGQTGAGQTGAGHWSLRQVPEVQGAFMAMEVNSGRVLAMQGGFSYQHSVFNRATQAMRQPGSAFKPLVYAAALDQGFTPATIVVDAPIEINTPEGLWRPKNASDRYYGPVPLRTGIEQSRNLMTVRLAQETSMETIAEYARRFGVYDAMKPYLANALGAEETTLWRMVAAYAMFANGGERVQPTLVDRVQNRFGKTIYRHDTRICLDCPEAVLPVELGPSILSLRERVMDPVTAYQTTAMMEGVLERGTGRSIRLPVPIAGKTGTTNDARDAWFIGYSSNIVAGCYVGHDQPREMPGGSGGGLCGPIFQHFMQEAVERFGGAEFAVPAGGYFRKIDRFSGIPLPEDAEGDNVIAEYFRDDVEVVFGSAALVDGGFSFGGNLPIFAAGETDDFEDTSPIATTTPPASQGGTSGTTGNADFGTLSSGGLY
jgi:penicillin-binding protein 1A